MEQLSFLDNAFKIENSNTFVALDVETTGFSPIFNELIEVSAIKYEDNKKIDSLTTLIKPKGDLPEEITKLTGITIEMLKDAPSCEEVMPKLIDFIGNNKIVAHNANFDYSFLQNKSNNSFAKNEVIDTLKLSKKMYPNLPNHKLNTISKEIGITEDGYHRAEFDTECCAKIYIKYLEDLKK